MALLMAEKNGEFPEKIVGFMQGGRCLGEIETRLWSLKGHVDFASSYLALWTLLNSLCKLKWQCLAIFNMLAPVKGKQNWTLNAESIIWPDMDLPPGMCWVPSASTKQGEVEGAQRVWSYPSVEPCPEYLNLSCRRSPEKKLSWTETTILMDLHMFHQTEMEIKIYTPGFLRS